VPSAPIAGESSILLPPVENDHLVAPSLPEVLNSLRPLCERSCSYIGQTVAASARATVHMIVKQIAAATAAPICIFILPVLKKVLRRCAISSLLWECPGPDQRNVERTARIADHLNQQIGVKRSQGIRRELHGVVAGRRRRSQRGAAGIVDDDVVARIRPFDICGRTECCRHG